MTSITRFVRSWARWAGEPIQIRLVEVPTLVARPLITGPHNVRGIPNVLVVALDEVDEEAAKH